jgi:hypothetical protein
MSLHSDLLEQLDALLGCKDERAEGTCDMGATPLDKILVLQSFDHTPYKVQLAGLALHG